MINPVKTHLHILQLEEYSPLRFLSWWLKHPLTFKTTSKKPLVITSKIKLLSFISSLIYLILISISFRFPASLLLILFITIEPFPLFLISLVLIKPYEIIRRHLTKISTHQKILNQPQLTIVGITGSYGKTSTKDILYQIISPIKPTIKTPESYNTLFGIVKTINFELRPKIKYFICEYGAYKKGEIKELVQMIPPQYAILTAIGTQHLERFKSLKNTTLAKFELIDDTKPENCLLNLDNQLIREHLNQPQYRKVKTYSLNNPQADFYLSQHTLTPTGIKFTLIYQQKSYFFSSPLFGTSNLQNLVAAISLAIILNINIKQIAKIVKQIKPSPHRLEIKRLGETILIDNSYSSNQQGFTNIISDFKHLKGKKAIITPGIVELGKESQKIHQQIGTLIAFTFDTLILVGKSDMTKEINLGTKLNPKLKINIQYINQKDSLSSTIKRLSLTHKWILLENDLPDNY